MSLIGQKFNGFKLLRLLGSGGMGEVYYAFHDEMKREAAVKVLYKKDMMRRFKNEAYIQSSVNHKNITQLYEFGEIDGKPCIAMEFVNGLMLDQYVQKRPLLSNESIKHIFIQVCEAINYLHEKGIQHRDIKPSNIKITEAGEVKLLDFGISKARYTPKLTQEGYMVGTVDFMSPEQFRGTNSIQSDVWALGVLLYFLCTKELPFQTKDILEQRTKINNASYTSPNVYNENIDRKYTFLISRMLNVKTSKRPFISDVIETLKGNSKPVAHAHLEASSFSIMKYFPWVLALVLIVITLKLVLDAGSTQKRGNEIITSDFSQIEVVVQNSNHVSLQLEDGSVLTQKPFIINKPIGGKMEILLKEGKYEKKVIIDKDFKEGRFMCTMEYQGQ
ncbi:Serine/threonine protein kinase [Spirosomataceae bacterium TFI 002]|nr:Serine/threonine protein kinase [Spirosomataceae bacterium TFI 002]